MVSRVPLRTESQAESALRVRVCLCHYIPAPLRILSRYGQLWCGRWASRRLCRVVLVARRTMDCLSGEPKPVGSRSVLLFRTNEKNDHVDFAQGATCLGNGRVRYEISIWLLGDGVRSRRHGRI